MEPLILHIEDKLARITLNRPEKRNALGREMVDALRKVFTDLSEPGRCKLAVITGSGPAFCAGADLASLQQMQAASFEQNLDDSEALAGLFESMHHFPGILLGAVNGHALAGGCGLVSLCDIAVTHEKARFGYTETHIGFVPAVVARYLIEKINRSEAARLLLGGQIVDAHEALRVGLVHEVTTEQEYGARVEWWTDHVMHELSGEAVLATKRLIRHVAAMGLAEAGSYAARVNAEARMSDDCRRGIAGFLAKEPLRW